jgi:BirA family transcriptional regulator, biotin operon repressor / biotin---[acetyl-CoA-carboxylase] ligase
MPLRHAGLPRHDARAEMTSPGRMQASRERHLHWQTQALWHGLEPLLPGLSIDVVARCASTNSELLERARIAPQAVAGRPGDAAHLEPCVGRRQADLQPCLLVAEQQTAGRGRLGRSWRSARGASLTFSLALLLTPRDWSGLSLAVGVALAQALQPRAGDAPWRLGLKWPNDLWLVADPAIEGGVAGGRKLGGVLIETLAAGERRLAVVGIGLNVAPLPEPLPRELQQRLGCLRELDPQTSAPATLARVALPLVQALKTFEREGFAAFAERYAALDLLLGAEVATTDARTPRGIVRGVDARGALRVETAGGVQLIGSGEVSVRPAEARHALHA